MNRYLRSLMVPAVAAGMLLVAPTPASAFQNGDLTLGLTNDDKIVFLRGAGVGELDPDLTLTITGKKAGDDIVAIDFQPSDGRLGNPGELFAMGSQGYFYTINSEGEATAVSNTPIDIAGATAWDIDFNPTVDRIRVATDNGKNYRVNPDTGAATTDTAWSFAAGDTATGTPAIGAVGYTNSQLGATSTAFYVIDTAKDSLLTTKESPNGGVLSTVGALGRDVSGPVAFDIAGLDGDAFASMVATTGSTSTLYNVNLQTGTTTSEGVLGAQLDDISTVTSRLPGTGYALAGADGGVFNFGSSKFRGSAGSLKLNSPVVDIENTDTQGYWMAAADGGIFNYGDAGFYGSAGNIKLNKPIVGMTPTLSGEGYYMVASDGGVFAYGDAKFYGSAGNIKLNSPIVGIAPSNGGEGYYLVAADGGVFAYGDAQFNGSAGNIKLNSPIVSMFPNYFGSGYYLVAADGGVFAYGGAPFFGSAGGIKLNSPIVDGAPSFDGEGYWLAAADGGVFAFNAGFYGSAGGSKLNSKVVGIASR